MLHARAGAWTDSPGEVSKNFFYLPPFGVGPGRGISVCHAAILPPQIAACPAWSLPLNCLCFSVGLLCSCAIVSKLSSVRAAHMMVIEASYWQIMRANRIKATIGFHSNLEYPPKLALGWCKLLALAQGCCKHTLRHDFASQRDFGPMQAAAMVQQSHWWVEVSLSHSSRVGRAQGLFEEGEGRREVG